MDLIGFAGVANRLLLSRRRGSHESEHRRRNVFATCPGLQFAVNRVGLTGFAPICKCHRKVCHDEGVSAGHCQCQFLHRDGRLELAAQ